MINSQASLIFFLSIILASCKISSTEYEQVEVKYSTNDLIFVDTGMVTIQLPPEYFPYYSYQTISSKIINDSLIMAMYNYNQRTIDLFNLDDYFYIKSIPFDPSINEFQDDRVLDRFLVTSIYLHSLDSIFLNTYLGVSIIDQEGIYQFRKDLNFSGSGKRNIDYKFENSGFFPIYFNQKYGKVFFHGRCLFCPIHSRMYYEAPFDFALDLKSGETTPIPISYSSIYKSAYYGPLILGSREIVSGEKFIYSFRADPNLYVYDLNENNIRIKGGISQYQTKTIPPLSNELTYDREFYLQYRGITSEYGKVYRDLLNRVYYRFYKKGVPIKNENGLYNTFFDREESLMIFNKDFKLINEINLESNKYFSPVSIPVREGLLIAPVDASEPENDIENFLNFHLIKVEIESTTSLEAPF